MRLDPCMLVRGILVICLPKQQWAIHQRITTFKLRTHLLLCLLILLRGVQGDLPVLLSEVKGGQDLRPPPHSIVNPGHGVGIKQGDLIKLPEVNAKL